MFSLYNFYYVLHANFLQPYNILDSWFDDFGETISAKLNVGVYLPVGEMHRYRRIALFYDQEPLIPYLVDKLLAEYGHSNLRLLSKKSIKILANSEKSEYKNSLCKEHNFYDWYYFFHGLIALEWYRDYRYVPKVDNKFTKVFITLNHLVTQDRSYRLNLIANILERNLANYGHISCSLCDNERNWKDEILDSNSKLSKDAKKTIYKHFKNIENPLVLDYDGWRGDFSAKLNLPLQQSGLWHVVTETVFYYSKLHLTEKIFKPIVARRPFILVGAPGNLAYLKSYGFKTFNRWIDESYDSETDNDKRISMIVDQIEKLCALAPDELDQMYQEMQDILDFNFNHFYNEFKTIIFTEMVDNFVKCLKQSNVGAINNDGRIDVNIFDSGLVLKRLLG